MRKFSSGNTATQSGASRLLTGAVSAVAPSELMGATVLNRFDAEVLKRAEVALAQHLGSVAKIIVKHAANRARDEQELYLLLGDEIGDKEARKAFVRKAVSPTPKH